MRRSLAQPTGLVWACLVVGGALAVLPAATAIDFGMVRVQQNSTANTSAAVTLTGTGGDPIVLSVSYDESLLGGMAESSLRLGWLDENVSSATCNQWVAAIDGNPANPVSHQTPFAGRWDSYWAAFTSANPSATLADARGAYGVDAVGTAAWAVIDHNSSFAVVPVPEPGVTVVASRGLGGLGVAFHRRCRS